MKSCMIKYATLKEQDAAREEWFATIDLRRLEMEEKKRHKVEAEKFFKEWWDVPKSAGEKGEERGREN